MGRRVSQPPGRVDADAPDAQAPESAPGPVSDPSALATAATLATPAGPGRYSQVLGRPKRAPSSEPRPRVGGAADAEVGTSAEPGAGAVAAAPDAAGAATEASSAAPAAPPNEPVADPWIGRVIDGRYRIDDVLGSGGVGMVYLAEHVKLRNPVALKMLSERFGGHEELRTRFEREARAQHRLRHPHIVALTDYGIADGAPFLVMELLEGATLSAWLRRHGPPEPDVAVAILRQILRGLAYAHGEGVAHRDLKPANVFLVSLPDAPHHVKLLDFGLAKMLDDDGERDGRGEPTITKAGTVLGTPAYMSPEQASGGRADARSDVYSAGVVFFELLTGRQPFPSRSRADQLRAHLLEPPPRLESVRPELRPTPALEAFLARALAKDKGDRFVDAGAMLAALDALPAPVAGLASADADEAPAPPPPPRGRRPWLLWLAAAAAVALAGAGWVAFRGLGLAAPGAAAADGDAPRAGAAVTAARPASPVRPPARDPFASPPAAAWAATYHALERGAPFTREMQRELVAAQGEAPGDARPSLLLARGFHARGWYSSAIERYVLAARLDPAARGDTRMRAHLLDLVGKDDPVGTRALAALLEVYGDEVRPDLTRLAADAPARVRGRYRAALAALDAPP